MEIFTCPICMSQDATQIHSTVCNHHFHSKCLHKWLQIDSTCPLCRHPISNSNEDEEWKQLIFYIMKINLTESQYQCVVEMNELYNISYYPLSNESFESMSWLPTILQT